MVQKLASLLLVIKEDMIKPFFKNRTGYWFKWRYYDRVRFEKTPVRIDNTVNKLPKFCIYNKN
jgi:hypothetical protein